METLFFSSGTSGSLVRDLELYNTSCGSDFVDCASVVASKAVREIIVAFEEENFLLMEEGRKHHVSKTCETLHTQTAKAIGRTRIMPKIRFVCTSKKSAVTGVSKKIFYYEMDALRQVHDGTFHVSANGRRKETDIDPHTNNEQTTGFTEK
jgi:hypothetical protein